MIIAVTATMDKETKNTYRYLIDKNKKGLSGSIYIDKETLDERVKKIDVKVKIDIED